MFCTNCGAPIPDDSRFCTNCGTPLAGPKASEPVPEPEEHVVAEAAVETPEEPVQSAAPQPAPQPAPGKKKMKKGALIGIIAGAVALVAIVLVLLLVVFQIGKVKIDLEKYVKLEYTGYDGGGHATASIDREQFLADYSSKIKYAKKYASLEIEGYTPAEDLVDYYVFCSIDANDYELKNGDEVICNVWADPYATKLFNVSFKNEKKVVSDGGLSFPVTVEGLEEAELFDPFEGIKISYIGTDPNGELEIDWSGCPEPTRDNEYYFNVDKEDELKNGDQVTITLDEGAVDYFIMEYGMAPSPMTYTFTVEGLPELVTSLSQIDATAMSEFETAANQIVQKDYVEDYIEGIDTTGYKLVGSILKVRNEPTSYGTNNRLYAVYEVNHLIEGTDAYTVYCVYSFENVGLTDGKLTFDAEDYELEFHSITLTVGNYSVSDYYGFKTIDDVKTHFITKDDADYTYDTNLP